MGSSAAYRAAHRKELAAKQRAYYVKNRVQCLKRQKARNRRDKVAIAERSNKYRAANKERVAAKLKAWNKAHRAERKAYMARYYKRNRKRFRVYSAASYVKNRQAYLERVLQWQRDNPESVASRWARRRARKLNAKGSHTAEEVKRILIKQKHRCANPRCRADLRKRKKHLDHKRALARGGSNDVRNLQWLCAKCNISKATRDYRQWLTEQRRAIREPK